MQKIFAALNEALGAGEVEAFSFADGTLEVTFAKRDSAEAPKPKRTHSRKPKAKTPVTLASLNSNGGDDLEIPEALRR